MEACYYCKKIILENDAFTRDTLDQKYKQTYHQECFKQRALNLKVIATKNSGNNKRKNRIYDWLLICFGIILLIEIIAIVILIVI
ncbi:hypothetical protein [Spiroplasma culicicola]|uniref:Uncharacterized protein n=1 Tax=Spiroplasma culicicola AES-1 TaxID=1276246 RepID=W6A692_9MOLU|nr:hypothetical protein [Spiroplasma culicicola]AHI52638.1 hypothetical protein SCULI_v1c02970 [Spiroplasma culicicola AES-1]